MEVYLAPYLIGRTNLELFHSLIVPLLMACFISLLTVQGIRMQVNCQEKRWRAERKETAYIECLNRLWQSRCTYFEREYVNHGDFLGRMQTLQFVEPWLIVAGSYSSSESQAQMEREYGELLRIIDLVWKETPEDSGKVDPYNEKVKILIVSAHGLPDQIDNLLNTVVECSKKELKTEHRERGVWSLCR